jgi:hypothetical protein
MGHPRTLTFVHRSRGAHRGSFSTNARLFELTQGVSRVSIRNEQSEIRAKPVCDKRAPENYRKSFEEHSKEPAFTRIRWRTAVQIS